MDNPSIKGQVYDNESYQVCVVRMPDMSFDTYGVINKATGVIEHIQPILYNAKFVADQLHKWMTAGPSSADEIESFLEQFTTRGKAN